MKSQSTLLKGFRKSQEMAANCLLSVLNVKTVSRMVETVCNIVLLLTAVDVFSPINPFNVFCMQFFKIVV